MLLNYTAKYSKIASGYMGQLVEWPEVVTEGKDIEECRMMLRDALNEMLLAYKQQRADYSSSLSSLRGVGSTLRPVSPPGWKRSQRQESHENKK